MTIYRHSQRSRRPCGRGWLGSVIRFAAAFGRTGCFAFAAVVPPKRFAAALVAVAVLVAAPAVVSAHYLY